MPKRLAERRGSQLVRYLVFDVGGTAIKHAVIDDGYRIWERGSIPTAEVTSSREFEART